MDCPVGDAEEMRHVWRAAIRLIAGIVILLVLLRHYGYFGETTQPVETPAEPGSEAPEEQPD
jgi:hypothetical protein